MAFFFFFFSFNNSADEGKKKDLSSDFQLSIKSITFEFQPCCEYVRKGKKFQKPENFMVFYQGKLSNRRQCLLFLFSLFLTACKERKLKNLRNFTPVKIVRSRRNFSFPSRGCKTTEKSEKKAAKHKNFRCRKERFIFGKSLEIFCYRLFVRPLTSTSTAFFPPFRWSNDLNLFWRFDLWQARDVMFVVGLQ